MALAAACEGSEPAVASLALLAGLAERRWRVQHFRARACPVGAEAVGQITGLPGRHLDAWLMPPEVCRTVFVRGAMRTDLAVVEGTLGEAKVAIGCCQNDQPGALGPIVSALHLPVVAIVPCARLESLHLPRLAEHVDAVLLDGLEDRSDFEDLKRAASLVLRKPVIGAVEALPEVRKALEEPSRDLPLARELYARLGASFLRFADLGAIRTLAESLPLPGPSHEPGPARENRFRVAYAQDDAFGGYFPDTLEMLELLGAEMVEFSPLRDEALPDQADLVMIGCGCPDRHADALAENLSLITALRAHVCQGQRIYAEGGGTAYLGRYLCMGERRVRVAGILPFDAELIAEPAPPQPVERTLVRDGWLGASGTVVRGYRSGRWRLRPAPEPDDCPAQSGPLTAERDLYFRHHAIGSLIHLHLAALPEVVTAFAGPHRPSLTLP